jgi:hypothetical protein
MIIKFIIKRFNLNTTIKISKNHYVIKYIGFIIRHPLFFFVLTLQDLEHFMLMYSLSVKTRHIGSTSWSLATIGHVLGSEEQLH